MMNADLIVLIDYLLSAVTIAAAGALLLRRFRKKESDASCAKGCASSCGVSVGHGLDVENGISLDARNSLVVLEKKPAIQ